MRDPYNNDRGLKRGGNPEHQYKPGQSGNPSGLPRGGAAAKYELARRIREQTDYGQLLIDYAKACVMGRAEIKTADGEVIPIPDDPKSRAYCHAWLTERGWGRPKQELVLTEKSGEPVREDMRSKTLAELRKIAAGEDAEGSDGGPVH